MTQYLPASLLAFFAPRPPLPFLPPLSELSHEKKTKGYSGIGQYLHLFEDPKDTPPPLKIESKAERLERKQKERLEKSTYIKEQGIALWDPQNNLDATTDPYKTLFIARIHADTTEAKLKKKFEVYGPIVKVYMIHDKITGKPKGYAFVEYENEEDMHAAYKHGNGKKIDDHRVLVDVERGRTVTGWLPRRLGGGLSDSKTRTQVREEQEEKNFAFRDRFDRRGGDRDRIHKSRSRDRDRKRRSKSRERERDRGDRGGGRDRDRNRDRDRHKDRHERKTSRHARSRDRHVASISPPSGTTGRYDNSDYSEQKLSTRVCFNDGDGGYTRKRQSRERTEKKRPARSRSRSRSLERTKRSRSDHDMDNNGTSSEKDQHQQYANYDLGTVSDEVEEGEDRQVDAEESQPLNSFNFRPTVKMEIKTEDE